MFRYIGPAWIVIGPCGIAVSLGVNNASQRAGVILILIQVFFGLIISRVLYGCQSALRVIPINIGLSARRGDRRQLTRIIIRKFEYRKSTRPNSSHVGT